MTFILIFLFLAIIFQGGVFIYSYRVKKKAKKDNILIKYGINSRSDLFSAICRNDIPQIDLDLLNIMYVDKKEI